MQVVSVYTDGSCLGNPGPGGWGVVMVSGDYYREIFGSEACTTNNIMELKAVIMSFKELKFSCKVLVYTDSIYVKNGMTEWISNWKRNGWKTSKNVVVKNLELWQNLDCLVAKHEVSWHWVKGHSGNVYNERANSLAQLGSSGLSMD